METNNYNIVTGYYKNPDFFKIWYDNTRRFARPHRIYVVNAAAEPVPYGEAVWLNMAANLGHYSEMTDQYLCGWSASILLGAMLCYHDRTDMIYKESDCLAFGPWVTKLYTEIGDHSIIFGQKNCGGRASELTAQSLVLVKWAGLLDFVREYLNLFPSDKTFLTEWKFDKLSNAARTTMGVDRSRPIPYDAECFYVQQLLDSELLELRSRNLI